MINTGRRRVRLAAPAVTVTIGAALALAACAQTQPVGLAAKQDKSGPSAASSVTGGGPGGLQLLGKHGIISNLAEYTKALKSGNWVETTDGLVNQSCVHTVPDHAVVRATDILLPSGARQKITPCRYPTLADPGTGQAATAQAPTAQAPTAQAGTSQAGPAGAGAGQAAAASAQAGNATTTCWFTDTEFWAGSCWYSLNWFKGMDEQYIVPAKPAKTGGLFMLWGGLSPGTQNDHHVIQGILAWGANGSQQPNPGIWWVIPEFAWNLTNGMVTGHPFQVAPGQTIDSRLTATRCGSNGDCVWSLSVTDKNTGASSQYRLVYPGVRFQFAQGAVLEVKHQTTPCNEMPANGHAVFRNLTIIGRNGKAVRPSFSTHYPSPHCGIKETQNSHGAAMIWSP